MKRFARPRCFGGRERREGAGGGWEGAGLGGGAGGGCGGSLDHGPCATMDVVVVVGGNTIMRHP